MLNTGWKNKNHPNFKCQLLTIDSYDLPPDFDRMLQITPTFIPIDLYTGKNLFT